jgi:broad specificity phosphatase PhoE
MKLILLRHEERFNDVGFFTPLTEKGLLNANLLANKLQMDYNKIDIVFCSPFIRTLQTIYPYCIKNKKKVNIEYALYEYIHNISFLRDDWYHTINDIRDENLKEIVNQNYESNVNKTHFTILEDEDSLERRIHLFFHYLFYQYPDKTILIVSHMGVINKIKDLYIQRTEMNDRFEMGTYEEYDFVL